MFCMVGDGGALGVVVGVGLVPNLFCFCVFSSEVQNKRAGTTR